MESANFVFLARDPTTILLNSLMQAPAIKKPLDLVDTDLVDTDSDDKASVADSSASTATTSPRPHA